MKFEDVTYWKELTEIMEWSKTNVFSTFNICWTAQTSLYYHYNIPKYDLKEKIFGVFSHWVNDEKADITRGLDDVFYAPHSRQDILRLNEKILRKNSELEILSESEEAGIFIVATKNRRNVFITVHMEYGRNTLKDEYIRDKENGDDIAIPKNYFKNDDLNAMPQYTWRGPASLVFGNWLNYCVYQNTPYNLDEL